MDLKKKVNLIFVPHEDKMPKQARLSLWVILLLGLGAFVIVGGIVYIIVSYTMMAIDLGSVDKVRADAENAEHKIEIMTGAIEQLEGESDKISNMKEVLVSMHDYGNEPKESTEEKKLKKTSWSLDDLEGLVTRASGLKEDLDTIENRLDKKKSLRENLPTMLPANGKLSTDYGYITSPITGKVQYHYAIDLVSEVGTPIYASGGGTVTKSGPDGGYGLVVEIAHGNTIISRYCHNVRNVAKVGDKVKRGDLIAYMGYTGNTTGTHLHYEVKVRGRNVDPKRFILEDIHDMDGNIVE